MKNTWICEKETVVVSSPVLNVILRKCRSSEDSRQHDFYLMRSDDWCNIIPVTEDGKVVLVKQFRIGVNDHTLEVPGGVIDRSDGDPQKAAVREMEEETGYKVLPNTQVTSLGWTHPNPAILNNRCFSYIVGPVRKQCSQKLDEGEMIEVVEVPITEIPKLILEGKITHALMLNAFFYLSLSSERCAQELTQALKKFSGKTT
jgi:8-oxo-dGTP pyrophosphatase MutT (NUDIX family)